MFSILNYGNLKEEDTDDGDMEKLGRMMKPPFEKVRKPKEKYMNRIAAKANGDNEILYQPKDDSWREDIDLGMFDTGMTTIVSPK